MAKHTVTGGKQSFNDKITGAEWLRLVTFDVLDHVIVYLDVKSLIHLASVSVLSKILIVQLSKHHYRTSCLFDARIISDLQGLPTSHRRGSNSLDSTASEGSS